MNLKGTALLSLLGATLFLTACSVEPEPIAYGSDACAFCRMTIVDKTHAAQLVTTKGKQFKYDAIECLVQQMPEWAPETIAHLKVADFAHPGAMIDAQTATYLISPGIRSPMGANLSAFADGESAASARDAYTGELFAWADLQDRLKADFSLE